MPAVFAGGSTGLTLSAEREAGRTANVTLTARPSIGACCGNGPGTESDCVYATPAACEFDRGLSLGD